ncbi:MAG: SURF1 family cytochrome oxidase biogenesis protein [Pontixanthobacter sp.]
MKTKVPVISTIAVGLAVVIMIALGVWQLGRADEKTAMLARYGAVSQDAAVQPYPANEADIQANLYRPVTARCATVLSMRGTAGTNAVGAKGWSHVARCVFDTEQEAEVALGWSRSSRTPDWDGGTVTGTLAPGGRIVADPPLAGLGPLARPDPADLPNNHLAYAGQWFLFALTALVIYVVALRVRTRGRA